MKYKVPSLLLSLSYTDPSMSSQWQITCQDAHTDISQITCRSYFSSDFILLGRVVLSCTRYQTLFENIQSRCWVQLFSITEHTISEWCKDYFKIALKHSSVWRWFENSKWLATWGKHTKCMAISRKYDEWIVILWKFKILGDEIETKLWALKPARSSGSRKMCRSWYDICASRYVKYTFLVNSCYLLVRILFDSGHCPWDVWYGIGKVNTVKCW